MDDNRTAYIKEQIDFLKAELERYNGLNYGPDFQPAAVVRMEASRGEMRRMILDLIEQMGNPQYEEYQEQEKRTYRSLLEKISSDDAALKAAKGIAEQCDDDEYRQEIIGAAVNRYEDTKLAIAKLLLEKLL